MQMINQVLLQHMLEVHIAGPNPTWNQPESPNGKIKLEAAHLLQTFAFADGPRRSVILLNLSRTAALPIAFAGPGAPTGKLTRQLLTATHITDSNEQSEQVQIRRSTLEAAPSYTLPPFSITTLTWTANGH